MRGFGDIPNLLAQGPSDMGDGPDFLSALLSGAGGAGGTGGGLPEQFAQMFGGQPGSTPIHLQAPKEKTWIDRLLPLVHLLSMVGLAFYAIFIIEPRIREGYGSIYTAFSDKSTWTSIGNVDWNGWAALSRGKQGDSTTSEYAQGFEKAWLGTGRGVATVVSVLIIADVLSRPLTDPVTQQIMYLFLTLELILQTTAIVIFKVCQARLGRPLCTELIPPSRTDSPTYAFTP